MRLEERLEERRLRMKAMAGVIDFFAVIGCAVLIVALVALLTNLGTWLARDLRQSFDALQRSVTEAIVIAQ